MSSRCKLLVDEVEDLSRELPDNPKPHEAMFFADKVKDAETAVLRAQQDFPDDADFLQIEARLRSELDQKDRALRALERARVAGPRGSGLAIRVEKIYDGRGREEDAERILKEALQREPEDKAAQHMLAVHYLRQGTFEADVVEQHLRSSFTVGDHNFEERFVLAEYLYYRGKMQQAADLFDMIDDKAPEPFRNAAPRRKSVIAAMLARHSGTIDGMKPRIFAHSSSVEPEVMSELSFGREVNFEVSFNRAGPVAVDIKLGRL